MKYGTELTRVKKRKRAVCKIKLHVTSHHLHIKIPYRNIYAFTSVSNKHFCLQRFDAVSWVTEEHLVHKK